ncbi:hypothetical protein F4818DRAFT_449017 [Hypoxylon cercidicola]|nr:hypothetical protein F4818DRAFT_449017 [Hypoxylon cercidicola]
MVQSPICQALNLSDGQPCKANATTWEKVFCRFHGKQYYGLYIGYKRRKARLDSLSDDAPPYLRASNVPLANEPFEGVTDEKTLREIHAHIYHEYALIEKVINAKKLHHKHFYWLRMDYGNQAYLDILSNRRHIVLRALEKLKTRITQALYEREKWYKWIRDVQQEEEATREKESKKVKHEAAMFKRYWDKMQTRITARREKEDRQRPDAYLDAAYQEHSKYIDLINHFLWIEVLADVESENATPKVDGSTKPSPGIAKKGKKPKSKAAKAADVQLPGQSRILEMIVNDGQSSDDQEPSGGGSVKSNFETESELRRRLKEGMKKDYTTIEGQVWVGTLEFPDGTHLKTSSLADEEIDSLAKEIKEIKLLLFCRLLLSHASLLRAAVKSSSVEEFLNDPEIAVSDLRDLCLRVEQPSLQDIRDACADRTRGDESEGEDDEGDILEEERYEDVYLHMYRYMHIQGPYWLLMKILGQQQIMVAGGQDEPSKLERMPFKEARQQKMKVQVCGKSIWNYSSENSTTQDGWLQFSVMAKDCDLRNAAQLCRNWDEFEQLTFLTGWQYFPASNWVSWGGDKLTQELHELGFFPYFKDFDAEKLSHLQGQKDIVETRNIIVGHMKRNDPATRRFLQYLTMRSSEVLVLVRDGKTGKILTAPEKDQLWTMRGKREVNETKWNILLEVGRKYFQMVGKFRKWRLGSEDYYDVWIWDYTPSSDPTRLCSVIGLELHKARRITKLTERHNRKEPFLRGLTRDQDTTRVRSIQPGEQILSLWDEITNRSNVSMSTDVLNQELLKVKINDGFPVEASPYLLYNEADAAEDLILFPEELNTHNRNFLFREVTNSFTREAISITSINVAVANTLNSLKADGDANWGTDSASACEDEETHFVNPWSQSQIWEDAIATINHTPISSERKELLRRVGLLSESSDVIRGGINSLSSVMPKLKEADTRMVVEKDRGAALVEDFHAADLEPGAQEKYAETCNILSGILGSRQTSESTDWVWFLATTLDWLDLRTDYDTYTHEPQEAWPHAFITQDIVKAFALMAMFFPNLDVCQPVTSFFKSEEGLKYKDTSILKPHERGQTLPDCRTRTSTVFRPKEFWKEWDEAPKDAKADGRHHADAVPMKWSVATRPIIAKLYLAGIVAPAYHKDPFGLALANTEPHRPDQLDLFINYPDRDNDTTDPIFDTPSKWPVLLPLAKTFASKSSGAKFAILRVWSAPHFYPVDVTDEGMRYLTSFLDSRGRSWAWRFVPKDMSYSESAAHVVLKERLKLLREQLKVGDRVVHRGEVILVMGTDELDLLRYVTAVTFAIQTKPWYREIDLWKSFVNVDLEFLEGLDPYWLD